MSPLRESTLSVVGAGVMAEAIIAGVVEAKVVPSGSIIASHPREDRRRALAEKYGVQVTADNADAARRGDVVGLGIKPQVMAGVLKEIRGSLAPDKLLISIIAGATTQSLRHGLDHGALVRVMPNTPAQISEGVNVWYATPETTETQREQARALLGALGHELRVDDERSEEHTSELQSRLHLVCRLLLEKKKRQPPGQSGYLTLYPRCASDSSRRSSVLALHDVPCAHG